MEFKRKKEGKRKRKIVYCMYIRIIQPTQIKQRIAQGTLTECNKQASSTNIGLHFVVFQEIECVSKLLHSLLILVETNQCLRYNSNRIIYLKQLAKTLHNINDKWTKLCSPLKKTITIREPIQTFKCSN